MVQKSGVYQSIGPVVYAIIYMVLYIPGGAGFLSSTEGADFIVESKKVGCAVCVCVCASQDFCI